MKKSLILLTLVLVPTMALKAQTENLEISVMPNDKVMEMHQALERSKDAFKEAHKAEPKAIDTQKHEADRAEFWEKVEHKKAQHYTASTAVAETHEQAEGLIKRTVDAIFNLFR